MFRRWSIKTGSMCEHRTKMLIRVMLFIKQFVLNSEGCAIFNLWDQNCGIWSLKQQASTVRNHRMSSSSWQLLCKLIIGEQPHCFQTGGASRAYWVHAHLYTCGTTHQNNQKTWLIKDYYYSRWKNNCPFVSWKKLILYISCKMMPLALCCNSDHLPLKCL